MAISKIGFGNIGERTAVKYLQNKGYAILDRNFQNYSGRRLGEIDIVAKDLEKNELVFIEVKTREFQKFKNTLPEENVTYFKMQRLSKIAQFYIKEKKIENFDYRFDVLAVWLDLKLKKAKIKHILNI